MKSFVDITLKPDAEIRENVLMNKVYTKLHKALFTLKSSDIGVSFPKFRVKLGDIVRIHGTADRLKELQAMNWLGGLAGYCDVSDISSIPDDVQYRILSRIQSTMTEAKLRRLIKRESISSSEAKHYKAKMFQKSLAQPYLELKSHSNGHKHRRYIQFGDLRDDGVVGAFDAFGLSKQATVPWF